MQELLEAVKQVRERIEKHGDKLRQNEMLTRYVLIDPILRALGWDTEDPEQVMPEMSTPQGRPDYGLYHNGVVLVMVEAKSLDTDLKKARDDGFKYCWQNKVPYFVVTDGNVWELHDLSKMGGEQIFQVRLNQDNPGDASRKLLALWRPAMPQLEVAPPSTVISPSPPPKGISLLNLQQKNVTGQKLSGRLCFPDGTTREVNKWKDLLVEVARWALPKLQQQKKLPMKKLVDSQAGVMTAPKKLDGWFVETNFSAKDCVLKAIHILKEAGIDPSSVLIEGWQPSEQRKRKR